MTTPHRTLQMALDALDAITDDVDGTGLNTMPSFDKAIDAIAALREALAPDHLRDVAEKAAPAAPVVREPRHVRKVGGSFQHTGTVVAEFQTTAGEPRIVLEFDAPVAGMLHVYRPDQVEPCEPVAPAEPVNREHAIALRDAELCGCEDMYFAARPQIDTLQARRIYAAGFKAGYEVRPPAQPLRAEPVALESVHLTRDINGMCTVRVNGRIAIHDNGDIIDHMATLEWFAQPAPVPLTDTETHAELWKLAVRKGLITVRSELIDPRNHGTRVSWMQGHDKACDISNDAAAHGVAASPAAPAAPVVPLTDERITKALRRAFSLGQTYWQQADSDSYKQNAKSDETRQKFETLIVETLNGITGGKP